MLSDKTEQNVTPGTPQPTENLTGSANSEKCCLHLTPEVTVNIVFFIILAITIILANFLVLASIYTNSRMRCPACYLILSLALADLMVGLFLLPVRITELLWYQWAREFMWCKMTLSLNLFSLSASLLNLLAVTADRFLAISYSLKYRTIITNNRIYVTITAVWLTAFVTSFLPLFGVGTKPVEMYSVHYLCRYGDVMESTYMTLFFALICAIPTLVITAAYFKMFFLARSQERKIAALKVYDRGSAAASKRLSFRRESKAAKTTAIVIGLFYFSWSPFFAGILITIFRGEAVSYLFAAITSCVVYSNSAINPLVYGFLNQEFKNSYKRLIKKLFRSWRRKLLSRSGGRVSSITMATKTAEIPTITATTPAAVS
ncbi:adenosine receptor A3-like [Montipora foliosa]|uniref:adenosine receptor A3-like n=1 Tax=Montipora foliosa TaxID=591990 RepID=UPI0035F1B53C